MFVIERNGTFYISGGKWSRDIDSATKYYSYDTAYAIAINVGGRVMRYIEE